MSVTEREEGSVGDSERERRVVSVIVTSSLPVLTGNAKRGRGNEREKENEKVGEGKQEGEVNMNRCAIR